MRSLASSRGSAPKTMGVPTLTPMASASSLLQAPTSIYISSMAGTVLASWGLVTWPGLMPTTPGTGPSSPRSLICCPWMALFAAPPTFLNLMKPLSSMLKTQNPT